MVPAMLAERLGLPQVTYASELTLGGGTVTIRRDGDTASETIEASLQLSEAVLVDLGVAMGPVIASIHERRDEFRKILQPTGEEARARQNERRSEIKRARARRRPVGRALAPVARVFGQLGLDLHKGAALEVAKGPLAQTGVCHHRQALGLSDGLRGVPGARQVAGVNGLQRLALGQAAREPLRLCAAGVVEADVELALDAGVHIPGGFTVADGENAGGVHARAGFQRDIQRNIQRGSSMLTRCGPAGGLGKLASAALNRVAKIGTLSLQGPSWLARVS